MKRLSILLLIINAFFINLSIAQPKTADTCYLPLEVGNKWQYIKLSGTTTANYEIKETVITKDTIINNKRYFYNGSGWQRYDKNSQSIYNLNISSGNETKYYDFNLPLGNTIGSFTAIGDNQKFLGYTEYCKGFGMYAAGDHMYKSYYMNNVGMVFYYYFEFVPGTDYREEQYLVGFYSADPAYATQIDRSAPTIKLTQNRGRYNGNLFLLFEIDHKYSSGCFLKSAEFTNPLLAYSYIQSANIKYFYSNGIDTLVNSELPLTKLSEFNYSLEIPMRYDLLNSGYKFYYQVNATDKALLPNTATMPASGFAELQLTKNENTDHYPLKIGNKWIYNVSQILPGGSLSFVKKELVKVVKDTLLSNGLKYYKLNYGSDTFFERIDTTLCKTYRAAFINGTIEDKLLDVLVANSTQNYSLVRLGAENKFSCITGTPIVLFTNYSVDNKKFIQTDNENNNYTIGYKFGILEKNFIIDEFGIQKKYNAKLTGAYLDGIVYGDTNVVVDVEEEENGLIIKDYLLMQNYPNPFNPATIISFSLPKETNVKLTVYNMLGQIVSSIFDGRLNAGTHSVEFNGSSLPSGIYFYKLETDNFSQTKKMSLLK